MGRTNVGIVALITWSAAVLAGLYMFAVWLIENDVTDRHPAATHLPPLVIFTHLLLAVTGLAVWGAYLLLDDEMLAWVALALLTAIALLGLTMFAKWIRVHHEPVPLASGAPQPGLAAAEIPAKGSFPVAVVAAHGLLAGSTMVLVLLTAIGIGGS
jgi:manganese efflux pump family protein